MPSKSLAQPSMGSPLKSLHLRLLGIMHMLLAMLTYNPCEGVMCSDRKRRGPMSNMHVSTVSYEYST